MRVLDSASGLLSRLQELAVLGANDTNTEADGEAIDREAEAIADEFHRLMSTSTYKGKNIFVTTAGSEYVSMGGRDAEMTFGLGEVLYSELYVHDYEKYAVEVVGTAAGASGDAKEMAALGDLATTAIMKGIDYVVTTAFVDADATAVTDEADATNLDAPAADAAPVADDRSTAGDTFTATATAILAGGGEAAKAEGQLRYTASEGLYTLSGGNPQTNLMTTVVQNVQAKVNTARVQAGSQYAALESAVNYTTDLTAQYELGYNTVNDVNFSMETAHLAKNQILQQAATAMLAQANLGQQGLLQLIS